MDKIYVTHIYNKDRFVEGLVYYNEERCMTRINHRKRNPRFDHAEVIICSASGEEIERRIIK